MDLKGWLESTGIAFEDTSWKKAPAYPYGVFLDDATTRGADQLLCIREHDLTVELYSDEKGSLAEAEAKVEALFISNAMTYTDLGRAWIESERHWQTTYTLSFTEKFHKEDL